ncbi:hypothetical protein [Salegentibacter sp. UBA1130]|uniref:hypothetical protein n=1 Tax=Salegentibacter sp. UBA1130 TaxID=1947451 RepID=UPI00257C9394|nr:hypothetical protein [Salegentibacter sp. UBA1130]
MLKLKLLITLFFTILVTSCGKEEIDENLHSEKSNKLTFVESSDNMVVSEIFISKGQDGITAEVKYFNNPWNTENVKFQILKKEKSFEINELSGLKRSVKIFKKGEQLSLSFFVNNSLVDIDKSEYTFVDIIEIIKNSNLRNERVVISKPSNSLEKQSADGTFNSVSSRCSTARAGVTEQIKKVGGYATTSEVDCYSAMFICWCSATVDLHGAGGSW